MILRRVGTTLWWVSGRCRAETRSRDDNDGIEPSSTSKVDTMPGYDVVGSTHCHPSSGIGIVDRIVKHIGVDQLSILHFRPLVNRISLSSLGFSLLIATAVFSSSLCHNNI